MFVLDGPGGAGKTYTFNVTLHMFTAINKNVQCAAWTGIASTLLPNCRTSASLFKLNIENDSKKSNHSKGNNKVKKLKEVDVISWEECSMGSKTALETVDFVLLDLLDSPFPFGRKRIILGGDFLQILRVIRRGTETDLINNCIKNSYLWNQFQKFLLLDNMRIINRDANWIKFLLHVGDGVANDYEDRVTLPKGLPVSEDLVDYVFGGLRGDISDAAILDPKNIDVDLLNKKSHSIIDGTEMVKKFPRNFHPNYWLQQIHDYGIPQLCLGILPFSSSLSEGWLSLHSLEKPGREQWNVQQHAPRRQGAPAKVHLLHIRHRIQQRKRHLRTEDHLLLRQKPSIPPQENTVPGQVGICHQHQQSTGTIVWKSWTLPLGRRLCSRTDIRCSFPRQIKE
uniref:ATP-dependent DNA helicase n=1 Tax=Caenorhabditis japonica TaxID=281687 RepID=A0A8R1E4N3_CAEJA